jgi:hypothetical protein
MHLNNIQYQGGANFEKTQTEIFLKCLPHIKTKKKIMIEIGSNDCHYSIIFNDFFKNDSTNICIEACEKVFQLGVQNSNNRFYFEYATVGDVDYQYLEKYKDQLGEISKNKVTISEVMDKYDVEYVNILHMDIQGSEKSLVPEIKKLFNKIQFLFISTHEDSIFGPTHNYIEVELLKNEYNIIFNNPKDGGFGDGLIVLENKNFNYEKSNHNRGDRPRWRKHG